MSALSKWTKNVLLFLVLFFYIYSVQFFFIPFGIGSRVILGILGFSIFLLRLQSLRGIFINHNGIKIIISLSMIFIYSSISIIYNYSLDFSFIKYPLSILIIYFAAFFVYRCYSLFNKYNSITLINYFVAAVFVQVCLSLSIFLYPSIKNVFFSMLHFSELDQEIINWNQSSRLIGVGSTFFGAGIVNSIALILLSAKIKLKDYSLARLVLDLFFYFSILFLGSMMSRTTVAGALIGGTFFLYKNSLLSFKIGRKTQMILKGGVLSCLFPLILYMLSPADIKEQVDVLTEFSLELANNYIEKGELTSTSTEQLKGMYKVYPQKKETYLLGDGHYVDPNFPSLYYMRIDVGYLRLIFYFGVIGLFFYLYFQYASMKYASKCFPDIQFALSGIFALLLILNLKGFTDVFFVLILFCFKHEENRNSSHIR